MGYGSLKKGKPGQPIINLDASYSALQHEYSYYLEAKSKGFPSQQSHIKIGRGELLMSLKPILSKSKKLRDWD